MFIQNEAGSNKRHYHDETTLEWKRTADVSLPYPYPYGFIIGTAAEDGCNVDCFVITDRTLKTRATSRQPPASKQRAASPSRLARKERGMRWLPVSVLAVMMLGQPLSAGQAKTVQASLSSVSARPLAPDFALNDGTGKTVRLSDYRGSVVLLDFWATKCGGCVEEIPMFIQVADTYRGKGLQAIGVSEDIIYENLPGGSPQAWGQVKPFVRDHKISYPVVVDDAEVHRSYDITALPLTYLIDVRGRVAAIYTGVVDRANLEENIARLLSEGR